MNCCSSDEAVKRTVLRFVIVVPAGVIPGSRKQCVDGWKDSFSRLLAAGGLSPHAFNLFQHLKDQRS
jgi:hypothetical protein